MYYDLLKIDKEMDMTKYSLKDLALYFEKFDGYICEIKTDNRSSFSANNAKEKEKKTH